jgi:hypothetical protein
MKNFFRKILDFILKVPQNAHKKGAQHYLKAQTGAKTTYSSGDEKLTIKNQEFEKIRTTLNESVKEIVQPNIQTPEKLLEYVERNGTGVYKMPNADKVLDRIYETEGFITPIKGLRALYLNFLLGRKLSFETPEMFILRDMPVNTYVLVHQFYKWYAYKMCLPGYDETTQEKFKKVWMFAQTKNIENLSYSDLASLKEAIERDIEAIDFTINLARENSAAQKMKDEGETDA